MDPLRLDVLPEQGAVGSRRSVRAGSLHQDHLGPSPNRRRQRRPHEPHLTHHADPIHGHHHGRGVESIDDLRGIGSFHQRAQQSSGAFNDRKLQPLGRRFDVTREGLQGHPAPLLPCRQQRRDRLGEMPGVDDIDRHLPLLGLVQTLGILPATGGKGLEANRGNLVTSEPSQKGRREYRLANVRVGAGDEDVSKSWRRRAARL